MSEGSEPVGRAKGGEARAAKLSPERRSEIARRAAQARHGLRATHKGNFKAEFGFDVECYVLNDEAKSAVVSLRGLGEALGFSGGSGSRLTSFVGGARIAPYVGRELRERLEKPLVFQGPAPGANVPAPTTYGHEVTLLIDLCKVVIQAEADGVLQKRHAAIARQAHVILGASAKAGIKGLVYALAGYSPSTEEVITAFKLYVQQEARKYEQEFPTELYAQWHRLYELPMQQRGKPWLFKHLTIGHVYQPLARSRGRILQLARQAKSEERNKKLFQFLSEIGVKALRTHLGQLLGIAKISKTKDQYEDHVQTIFGDQPDLFKS